MNTQIQPAPLYVVGSGVVTAVGDSVDTTMAACMAGISGYQLSTLLNHQRQPFKLAPVPDEALAPLQPPLDELQLDAHTRRLLQLCDGPLKQALTGVGDTPVTLLLSIAEPHPHSGDQHSVDPQLLSLLAQQTGLAVDLASSRVAAIGRSGGLFAIQTAAQILAQSPKALVVVGGVNSWHGRNRSLLQLDQDGRLLSESALDGYVPGEAAGFVLLAGFEAAQALNLKPALAVYPPGTSRESGHLYSEEPKLGLALSEAVRTALGYAGGRSVELCYSSLNGEHFWARELGVMQLQNQQQLAESFNLEHPAEYLGDIGAATAPVYLALMSRHPHKTGLLCCSSDGPQRAAVVTRGTAAA